MVSMSKLLYIWACSVQLLSVASQKWLSGPVADPDFPLPGTEQNAAGSRTTSPRLFDLTFSLHSNPQGDDDGTTQDDDPGSVDQDKIEKIIQFMADAVYEATEGAHKLRKARIFRESRRHSVSDVRWDAKGHPAANLNGISELGGHIYMYDDFDGTDLLVDLIGAGYTLAHEFAHYALGLRDEYELEKGDVPVTPSIMNSQWKARSSASQVLVNANWLQFSIKNQDPKNPGKFQDTLKTAQHRFYGESCWETLSRSNSLLEGLRSAISSDTPRVVYPELALVAPNGTAIPKKDLPGNARSDLEIIWEKDNIVYEIVLDKSGSMSGTKISNARTAAKLLVDLAEIGSAIGVIAFSGTPTIVSPIVNITDQASKDTLKAAIDTIFASGSTAIGSAAQLALNELLSSSTPDGTKVVFLLSDGLSGDNALAPIPAYVAAQIPIFTFSYGADADTATLGEMASATEGRLYISPVSLDSVSSAFLDANDIATSSAKIATGSGTAPTGAMSSIPVTVESTLKTMNVICTFSGVSTDATIKLVTPSGTQLDPDQVDESGGETLLLFSIAQPQAGEWQITAQGTASEVAFSYQASAEPDGVSSTLAADTFNGNHTLDYPEPFVLKASFDLSLPILNGVITAEITDPNGTTFVVDMTDDGVAPDSVADDGIYSAAVQYDQSGMYEVLVRAVAQAGVATQSGSSLEPSAGEDGNFVPFEEPEPLTEDIQRFERFQVEVNGVVEDDHGDTFGTATFLSAENLALVPGRIETAGDVDMFEIFVPTQATEIVIRVSNLAFGMEPLLDVFDSTGTLITQGVLSDSSAQGGYLAFSVPTIGGETLFASVSHAAPDGTGWYQVSAGNVLFKDLPKETSDDTKNDTTCCTRIYRYFQKQLTSFVSWAFNGED